MDYVPKPRLWKSKADFFRPFRTAAAEAGENIVPLYDPVLHRAELDEPDLSDLNAALSALVEVFPDVHPEVFREMLLSVSAESRLQVVTEHLLAKKAKWIRGRYRVAPSASSDRPRKRKKGQRTSTTEIALETALPYEETFRSDSYKKAVKQVFYEEFKTLSHSSIKGVLAEQNFSYTLARPSLQQLWSRSWRFSFSSMWLKRSTPSMATDHPYITWQSSNVADAPATPSVRRTGSARLDQELYDLFVAPVLESQRQKLLADDFVLALKLNEAEAESAGALFDCQCCFGSVPFEQISLCNGGGCHHLCFECVRRTVNEALFGQGWACAVDLGSGSIRCFAPVHSECLGTIPVGMLRLALSQGAEHEDTWNELQERAASEVLAKSRLRLQRCPFCNYAEVNETPALRRRKTMVVIHHVANKTSIAVQLVLLTLSVALFFFTIPLLVFGSVLWVIMQIFPLAASVLDSSWARVYKQRRGLKFRCHGPGCSKTSCVRCLSIWKDPHVCFENEKTSLRTAIESSATAAVKRTCPKCLLSFVKSSGCNKLVCNCGYTMCYICRQEITSKEGYSHFCQHFRPHGGRCGECERCDLYGDEDEEAVIRHAAIAAEKAWKEKEGGREGNVMATQAMVEALVGQARGVRYWEAWLDALVAAVAA